MRISIIIILFYIAISGNAQKKINFGLDLNISVSNAVDFYALKEIQGFIKYKNIELFGGYNQTNVGFGQYNVNGFVIGSKYHFQVDEKISHFVAEFNYQNHKYWNSIGTPPLNGKFDYFNTAYNDLITGKTINNAYLLGIGYEFKMNNHFMFYPCIGSGLAHTQTTATEFGIQNHHPSRDIWKFSPYIKLAFRFYFFRFGEVEKDVSV